ncbi:MAG: F0F1 ATP synthase subunit gamma [Clostridia bacterium]|nr:F0F1 ATP synthase subunit gamma [Clostridia bacterium]
MAGQRELKKHLSGIRATGKLANAMKTVSTAKFSKLSALNSQLTEYSVRCGELLRDFGDEALFGDIRGGEGCLYVMFTGNKGLCGGYNSELVAYFEELEKETPYKLIVCGKKGMELCRAKGIAAEELSVGDVPCYGDAGRLFEKIAAQHPVYGTVKLVYREFKNVMLQIPTVAHLLPAAKEGSTEDIIYFPSREEIETPLAALCIKARLYGVMVEAATGVQGATLMTMRNAADNAEEEALRTETALNRLRQKELTADVIESSSGAEGNFYK